ncbi:MAG TPA: SusC/RagA family TonB-linked outer membrane protein [Chryseolinea sp.]|nr:SusC/RagA family TonB-linked outer membrane protein [Chryseolinea sp.]
MKKRYLLFLMLLFMFLRAMPQEAAMYASLTGPAKPLHDQQKDVSPLTHALRTLEKSFKISIAYKDEWIENKISTIDLSKFTAPEQALDSLLSGTGLYYEKAGENFFVIYRRTSSTSGSPQSSALAMPPEMVQTAEDMAHPLTGTASREQLLVVPILATISGTVKDENGLTFPGVNIVVKGTTAGTTTDINGKYTLSADEQSAVLVFSFVGYKVVEVAVAGRTVIDVALEPEVHSLEEVVVTALGIKKETKRLGYATSTATPDQITENRTTNFVNSLQGKMAGVNITPMGTGPSGSSKIRIRGQSSFGSVNSPLIVVNGVPIDNTSFGVGGSFAGRGATGTTDGGDGLSSINPDDIESMTVLKGGAAAALYGSRAKDGVIMITTKSTGKGRGIGVEFNSNYTSDTPLDFTDFQYEYGQGEFGVRPTTPNPTSGVWSFGEKFQPGMTQVLFDGVEVPYEAVRDRIKKFYRVGSTWTNTVSMSTAGENGGLNLSLSNMDNKSIQPNTVFNRKTINLGFNQKLGKKLVISGNLAYSREDNKNPVVIGGQDISTPVVIYTMSNSMPLDLLSAKRFDASGNEFVWSRFRNRTNPYISVYDRFENVLRDRLFGNITARYNFTDWLYVQGRIGQDYFSRDHDFNDPTGRASNAAAPAGFVNGRYTQEVIRSRELNTDFLIGANRKFGDFAVDITLGGNQRYSRYDQNVVLVQDFVIRDLYTVMNGRVKDPFYDLSERKINSLYGAAEFSYKEYLYLNVTARNDWFSTLAPANRSILYPSVNGSFVFTQAFQNLPEWLSYGKIRAGYAEVGSDADVAPYANSLYYSVNNNLFNNPLGAAQPVGVIPTTTVPNPDLKPMRVSEAEVGFELKFFENRVGLDFTYYNKISRDQILAAQISDGSGYTAKLINVGESKNNGIELLVTGTPVQSSNVRWDVSFNGSYNTSEVLNLGPGVNEIVVGGDPGNNSIRQVVGEQVGGLYVTSYLRDDQGRQVFDPNNGRPLRGPSPIRVGTAVPRYFGGITNSLNVYGVSFSFLIDFKLGHYLGSATNFNLWRHGLHKETLNGREQGYVVGDGVNPNGETNAVQTPLQTYYETVNTSGIREEFAYNAGFWKLRQITLGYDFTKFLPVGSFVKGVKVSAVANNVAILKKWVPNIDPEQFGNVSDREVGLEGTGLPTSRSIGFNLNVKF